MFRDGRAAVGTSWFFCARLSRVTALVRDSVIIILECLILLPSS